MDLALLIGVAGVLAIVAIYYWAVRGKTAPTPTPEEPK